MFHRDYVIRLLQQFIMMMAKLTGLLEKDDPRVVELELESGFQSFLGLPRHLAVRMDVNAILHMLSVTGELDADRAAMMGLLFRKEAELARSVSEDEAVIASFEDRAMQLIEAALKGRLSEELRHYLQDASK